MFKYLISIIASASMTLVSATSPSIGFVKSTGEFRVDGSAVHGNGTVFEGNLVETTSARSVIQLADAQITLAPNSSARVYRDRTVLEKGSGFVKDGARHVVQASTLRIVPSTQDSVVQIEITGPSHVTVAARGGAAEVRNSSGILTASLLPGMSLAFSPQAAADAAVKMTGVIESRGGAYFLTDETTGVTVQLESPDASKYVGKKVEITGSSIPGAITAGGASQLVRAVTIKSARKSGDAAAAGAGAGAAGAGAAGAGAAGAGAAGAGLSGAALGAVVGGVAVGGTAAGLAAVGTFSSSKPVSRR
jgi:hypothetical protein